MLKQSERCFQDDTFWLSIVSNSSNLCRLVLSLLCVWILISKDTFVYHIKGRTVLSVAFTNVLTFKGHIFNPFSPHTNETGWTFFQLHCTLYTYHPVFIAPSFTLDLSVQCICAGIDTHVHAAATSYTEFHHTVITVSSLGSGYVSFKSFHKGYCVSGSYVQSMRPRGAMILFECT